MLEDLIVIGIVMAVVEIVKHLLKKRVDDALVTQLLPLIVLGLAGALNVANAAVFGGGEVTAIEALGEGIKFGAIAGGVYSLGKAALGKS